MSGSSNEWRMCSAEANIGELVNNSANLMSIKHRIRNFVFKTCTRLWGDDNGMVVMPVLSGLNRGRRLKLDLSRFAEPGYLYGTYDKDILRAAVALGLLGKVVWECGTYLGYYTIFFARQVGPKGRVVAFEPDPENMARTKFNCGLNKLTNVDFRQVAIGAPLGETEFAISSIETNSHLPGAYVGASREAYEGDKAVKNLTKVTCLSLDQALLEGKLLSPDIVKMDIEGAELLALDHMSRLVQKVRPKIILELHNPQCDAKAWEFANKYSYALSDMGTGRRLTRRDEVRGTLLCAPSS